MTRGIEQHLRLSNALSTNVSGSLTESLLEKEGQNILEQGGSFDAVLVSSNNKRTINGFSKADEVKQDVNERSAGRIINFYEFDNLGEVPIVVDQYMPDDFVGLLNTNLMNKGWFENDQLRYEVDTNQTTPRKHVELLHGNVGLEMKGLTTQHKLLYNLT